MPRATAAQMRPLVGLLGVFVPLETGATGEAVLAGAMLKPIRIDRGLHVFAGGLLHLVGFEHPD
ncbi:hypothetical protein D3C84_977380 [compost metagenome]